MKAIGLMSGTSADGVDAALVEIGESDMFLLGYVEIPFPKDVRREILSLCENGRVDTICRMDAALGEWFAEAALRVCEKANVSAGEVDVIGSHGQTIHHLPSLAVVADKKVRSTLQIGSPAVIAERTGITTVSDFRSRDMAVGGQGAPLVPLVDYLLFRSDYVGRAMLNIGGIANVNILPANCGVSDIFAFDTGPGNMVIDGVVQAITRGKQSFDRDGVLADKGQVCEDLLDVLMAHPFFDMEPPKSTGREDFGADMVQKILDWEGKREDLVRTAVQFTVESIVHGLKRFVLSRCEIHEVIVSGGGTKNPVMMDLLDRALGNIAFKRLDDLGMASEAKEAIAFAILACQTLNGHPGNVPSVTGADKQVVLGSITPGERVAKPSNPKLLGTPLH
ncbi:MAG: anhydro-N-acetylmuramic acid kinase [Gemmatimonadetes bacterium]|nr:anhydro-N-acetylmuramic acid kinase [Gemmatimonadota bacterium]MYF75059.1 anhydro-N-acetylmuramic acid kinase [Gemmatimonadota bacterium]MYK52800.1 anhydro-N-acetylmuramic acid kinase [Gemmatimonadota bacterium]